MGWDVYLSSYWQLLGNALTSGQGVIVLFMAIVRVFGENGQELGNTKDMEKINGLFFILLTIVICDSNA